MSRSKNDLCARILKDLYGELPYKIGKYLMAKGACPLRLITTDTKIPHNSVSARHDRWYNYRDMWRRTMWDPSLCLNEANLGFPQVLKLSSHWDF